MKIKNPHSQNKKNLGRLVVDFGYIVNLDDPEMIAKAKQCFYDDLIGLVKYNEVWDGMKIEPAPKAKTSDIPAFLLPEFEEV